jgi:spermidine dehydrogenase
MTDKRDKHLGMDRAIDRRDLLGGGALLAALGLAGGARAATAAPSLLPGLPPGWYPPLLHGLRGSTVGTFEAAHALRDGLAPTQPVVDTGEQFDLVIVGAGMSGLAAAWFARQRQPTARILILDNHDDIGGHARRNEYWLDGQLHLLNGGTLQIDSPRPYSVTAAGLLTALGIQPTKLREACYRPDVQAGLTRGVFLDKAHFGQDALLTGVPGEGDDAAAWAAFLAKAPLDATARADIIRVETDKTDLLAGQDDAAKKDYLSRMSWRDWLLKHQKISPAAMAWYQSRTQGEWCAGADAVSALDAWGFGLPGFAGLALLPKAHPRMSFTPAGYVEGGSETFHFPDGNASIARLLVRALVPGSLPGGTPEDAVTARLDYGRLDAAGQPVRIRLNSTVLRAENADGGVSITWMTGGQLFRARAGGCVLACYNAIIPHMVPDLPAAQAQALHELVKGPLVYASVALRHWRPFVNAGVRQLRCPGSYWTNVMLNWPVDIGDYRAARDPDRPGLIFLARTPCQPGLSEHDQARAGRAELLATPFSTFEREIRQQLQAMLGSHGLDTARDIMAITVNRWPHGYAPEYNFLWQPEVSPDQMPHIIARQPHGRISIANSDSGNGAYTDIAIDQAARAVAELG